VTVPSDATLMNLYSMTVPGVRFNLTYQRGLEVVYKEADNVTASAVFQEPRAAMEPEILIVSP